MQIQLIEGESGAGWGCTWLPTLHGPEISAFSTCRYNSLKEYVGQVGAVLGCQPCTTEIQRIPCKQVQLFSKMTGRLQAQVDPAHFVQAGAFARQHDRVAARLRFMDSWIYGLRSSMLQKAVGVLAEIVKNQGRRQIAMEGGAKQAITGG